MPNIQLETFTDRSEAIALFHHLRGRDPTMPWPLLPILAFIAPSGSGKSTLIEYLRAQECCLPDPPQTVVIPYAHLDFTLPEAPKDLLSILIALRNQLQQHRDNQGKYLTFPRFDIGAAIASTTLIDGTLPLLSERELRRKLVAGLPLFGPLGEMGFALGNIFGLVPPILVGLRWASMLPPLQTLLQRLEQGPGWRWYQAQSVKVGLPPDGSIKEVLLRLHHLSIPGTPRRGLLVEHLLPAAFLADLCDALDGPHSPLAWSKVTNVILFLDGFDALLEETGSTGIRILEVLACSEHRKLGQTDPLLLVLGSRQRLLGLTDNVQHPPFENKTKVLDKSLVQQQTHTLLTEWQQQIPAPERRRYLRLSNLLIPHWLQDFGLDHTHDYLARVDEHEQTSVFKDEQIVQVIHHSTLGHPLYMALAAASVLEAETHGQKLSIDAFSHMPVPSEVVYGHQNEQIGEYLLALFLRQLSQSEQQDLIFLAVPRMLDVAIMRVVLELHTEQEALQKWERYRRFTFVRMFDDHHLVLHPLLRVLLLQRLIIPSSHPSVESDFYRIHLLLRNHFHQSVQSQGEAVESTENDRVLIEEAYHALALGKPDPAIRLGIIAQQKKISLWRPLLDSVAQAPTVLISKNTGAIAFTALKQAEQRQDTSKAVTAIILYTWLLVSTGEDILQISYLYYHLGVAYSILPGGDRQANLEQAIHYFTQAIKVRTRETFAYQWATIQNGLGDAFSALPHGDRQANLEQATQCYNLALEIFTREVFPSEWAIVLNNLGQAYSTLPQGDRQANLEQAIHFYNLALEVRTREAFSVEWAKTQNNLGLAFSDLPQGDRQANLEQAIRCFTQALQVLTRENFPFHWATIQSNLGSAYTALPQGDRQANLEQAIRCLTQALQVFSYEAYPSEWAGIQNNLGHALAALPQGDQQANREKAIHFYNDALKIFTRETYPNECADTQENLGIAYLDLLQGDRQANLKQAIYCFTRALEVRTREAFPNEWAKLQNSLGSAYSFLLEGDQQVNLEQAIHYFNSALEVFTRVEHPVEWARAKNNLGHVYRKLLGEDKQVNLEQAIHCFIQALEVFTRIAFPDEWATVQNNLGLIYTDFLQGDRQANLEQAIHYCSQALEVRTRGAFPDEWARIQANLGNIYSDLSREGRQDGLEQAIYHYTQATEIFTREVFPYYWATIQISMGNVYSTQSQGNQTINLKRAINYYTQAIEVLQSLQMIDYADTVNERVEKMRMQLQELNQDYQKREV